MLLERISRDKPHPIVTLDECLEHVRTERDTTRKKGKTRKKVKFLRSSPKRLEFWAAARRMVYFPRNTPVGMIVRLVDKEGVHIAESRQRLEDLGIGVQYVREVIGSSKPPPETEE
jgi:hypothetical protein